MKLPVQTVRSFQDIQLNFEALSKPMAPYGMAWHAVGAAGEPGFQNGWVNYGSSFRTAAFAQDSAGVIHVVGLVKSGTMATTIFTLPTSYRPSGNLVFPSVADNGSGVATPTRLDVNADGTVVASQGGTNGFVSLSVITFRAEA